MAFTQDFNKSYMFNMTYKSYFQCFKIKILCLFLSCGKMRRMITGYKIAVNEAI